MEILIGIIVALLGGLFLVNKKNEKAEVEKLLVETKVKDQVLAEQQALAEQAIAILDKGIEEMKRQKQSEENKRAEDSLTLKQRADRMRKGLK